MVELIQNTNFSIQFVLDKINAKTNGEKEPEEEEESRHFPISKLQGFEAKNISEGSAFLSIILRLTLQWKEPRGDLPSSIIMKVPGPQHKKLLGEGSSEVDMDDPVEKGTVQFLIQAHQREIRFYQHFPQLDPGLRLPKFYFGSEYHPSHREGLILMEDLTPRGATVPTLPGFNHAQVLELFGEVARLHAASWHFPEWLDKIGSDEIDGDFVEEMRENGRKLKELDPLFGPLFDRFQPLFTHQQCALSNYTGSQFGFLAALVHADLWAANVLWERDELGRASDRLCAIIDWQCAHSGNPCEDLIRILSLNTSGQYRRENETNLLEYYAGKVAEFMGGEAPFTMEQLKEAYKQAMPMSMMFMCYGMPFYHGMDSVVGKEPAEREKNQKELLERCRMFLEDTIHTHGI